MKISVCVLILLAGVIIGLIIGRIIAIRKTMGRLRIDHSEPDEPTSMFVELKGVTPDMIAKHKIVMFEVINENYISRD